MLKIWGRLSSVNVQKVMWAVRELALPHERIDAGGEFGIVNSPEYVRLNPNSKVPLIDDGGFVLWESNAIVRYLSSRYGEGSLWSADPCLRGDADRWMDWQATEWQPSMVQAFMGLVRTPEAQRNHAAIKASLEQANAKATLLDHVLQGREFVTGPQFTMGDIVLGCAAHRWMGLPVTAGERPALPALSSWYRRLMMRPAVQGILTLPLK